MKKGKFIVLEGLEGAGKTSACKYIQNFLYNFGIKKTLLIREPGSTFLSEKIRKFIKFNPKNEILNYKTIVLLLYASRLHLTDTIIKPTLKKGIWVISDRYELSTFAYQGQNSQKRINFIKKISSLILKKFYPNLTIYLDVLPHIGLKRIKKRGILDNIEKNNINFFLKVQKTYLKYFKKKENIFINANLSQNMVQKNLKHILLKWLKKNI
ncbi:dTMP kinase [Buchnera aphidicola]|uniref:dTMP kinase n=1 Tax=Buchnera aphidicola TaxID=9 RepID=UPI0031B69B23